MHTILLVHPDAARREAVAARLRATGHAVALAEDAAGVPPGLRPDILVVHAALSVRARQELVGHIGQVHEIVDTGDTERLLRELSAWDRESSPVLSLSAVEVDLRTQVVFRGGETVSLTDREAALLAWLASRAGQVATRAELLVHVWGYRAEMATRTVDVTVARLRDKIEQDPAAPQHLLTVRGEGYRLVLPEPPAPSAAVAGLLGREPELRRLRAQLGAGRVVTVIGPGGVGKTTLVRALVTETPDHVWCDLVPVGPGQVVAQLARTLETSAAEATGRTLGALLQRRGVRVLVVDNTEHVVEEAAELIAALLDTAPALCVVATSRSRLRTPVEVLVDLRPLAMAPALALFLERARRRAPDYGRDTPPETLQAIVATLDGLPLALELGAARARLLAPAALLERLQESIGWLRDREAPARTSTLLATVAWSWALLDTAQQRCLAALSVFRGGATLDAVEAVLAAPPGEAAALIDSLVDLGLLRVERQRIWAYVGVQELAAQKLAESGQAAAVTGRYRAVFARLARTCDAEIYSAATAAWRAMERLQVERANLLHALHPDVVGDITLGLLHQWEIEQAPEQELTRIEALLPHTHAPLQRVRLLRGLCWVSFHRSRLEVGQTLADELARLAQALPPEEAAWAWFSVGLIAQHRGDVAYAEASYQRTADLAPGDSPQRLRVVLEQAGELRIRGEYDGALALQAEAARIAAARGGGPLLAAARLEMASILHSQGRFDRSLVECRAVLAVYGQHGSCGMVAIPTGMVGINLYKSGRPEEGLPYLDRCLELATDWGARRLECLTLQHRCRTRILMGHTDAALGDALAALELSQTCGPRLVSLAWRVCADCWLELGDLAEADAALEAAAQITAQATLEDHVSPIRHARARAALIAGESALVEEILAGQEDAAAIGLRGRARLLRGDADALPLLEQAVAQCPEITDQSPRAEALAWLALARQWQGDTAGAEALLVQARSLLEQGWGRMAAEQVAVITDTLQQREIGPLRFAMSRVVQRAARLCIGG